MRASIIPTKTKASVSPVFTVSSNESDTAAVPAPVLFTDDAAARYLSVSVRTIKSMRATGALPYVRIGQRNVRLHRDDCDAFIRANRIAPTETKKRRV